MAAVGCTAPASAAAQAVGVAVAEAGAAVAVLETFAVECCDIDGRKTAVMADESHFCLRDMLGNCLPGCYHCWGNCWTKEEYWVGTVLHFEQLFLDYCPGISQVLFLGILLPGEILWQSLVLELFAD